MKSIVSFHLAFFTLVSNADGQKSCISSQCRLDKNVLKFLVLGDWGGQSRAPYYTTVQRRVAEIFGQVATEEMTDFQISVGDNFYPNGVNKEADPRFQDTFEDVYDNPRLIRTPWYIMAGNHDHYGNVLYELGYTKRSERWIFPWLYYEFGYALNDDTTVDFMIIDTTVLCEFGHGEFSYQDPSVNETVEAHWRWIQDQLSKSKADYIFVAGHNPVYSIGSHGPTKCLIDRLEHMLEKFHVTAHFSGHDHNLQHLIMRDHNRNITVHQIISGSGGFASRKLRHIDDVPDGSSVFHYPDKSSSIDAIGSKTIENSTKGGFVMVRVDRSKAEFIFYNGRKDIVHNFSVGARLAAKS